MEFKEIEIIKDSGIFGGLRYITTYHEYFNDEKEIFNKIINFPPHKGDVIRVMNSTTHVNEFLQVKYIYIDYIENRMTIWRK